MNVTVKSINVGKGDCFFLCLKQGKEQFNIMIDCMTYNNAVKKVVEEEMGKHINLLIVSHIDDDHVPGIEEMICKVEGLVIDEIWFNSYQRKPLSPAQELSEYHKKRFLELKGNMSIAVDLVGKADVNDARLLSETILDYENKVGRKVWTRDYIKYGYKDVLLGNKGKFGSIKILTPVNGDLEELDKKFLKMFRNLFYEKHETPLQDDACIYEMIMHYVQMKDALLQQELKVDATSGYNEENFIREREKKGTEARIENKASISFMWSYGSHKILFTGDAGHAELSSSLKNEYGKNLQILDAIKVSHHGAMTNTSSELLSLIDSAQFFIPCGTAYTPALSTLSKIVTRQLPNGIKKRTIRYNNKTKNIKKVLDIQDTFTKVPPFILTNENEFKFTC